MTSCQFVLTCVYMFVCVWYLIKVGNDLIEKSQAFKPLIGDIILIVKFPVVWNGSKHDTDAVMLLRIKVLHRARPQERAREKREKDRENSVGQMQSLRSEKRNTGMEMVGL